MLNSMTGFGTKATQVKPVGKVNVELRSSNHKFLEIVFHLPEGLMSLEGRMKKEIESRVKRGRITCGVSVSGPKNTALYINKALVKKYLSALNGLQRQCRISGKVSLDTLMNLPGVLSLDDSLSATENLWPRLKPLLAGALDDLSSMRRKEGKALQQILKKRQEQLKKSLDFIRMRFKAANKEKLKSMQSDEERTTFLKETDITEEIDRLAFHLASFKAKLSRNGPVGKELDFIAQEMQREANTLGAKTFDAAISGRVVQVKSQIEKIREQVQNIE